jgi:hypothetical protein
MEQTDVATATCFCTKAVVFSTWLPRRSLTRMQPTWPMRLAVGVLALLFGIGLWRGVRWAWWDALFLVLAMLSWLAIATAMMLGTAEGGSVLRGFAIMPAAVASTLAELGLLILLLLPATRYYFRRSAA